MSEESQGNSHRSVSLILEEWGPTIASVTSVVVLVYFADYVSERFVDGDWNAPGLYRAIFSWGAIQTGFSFGVFGFVIGRNEGFIGKLQETKAMERFLVYVKWACYAGFLLSIFSIPVIVSSPVIQCPLSWSFFLVALWFAMFVWAFFAFLRVAVNFIRISNVKPRVFHGA